MKIIDTLCAVITIFAVGVTSAMMHEKPAIQVIGAQQQLVFEHHHKKIAEIPLSVGKNVSPVFKQQLCGSKVFDTRLCPSMEMKQDKVTMGKDSLKIDVDEFDPETVTLFTRMVNAPTALANQQAISAVSTLQVQTPAELQKMLVNDHSDLVLDLYGFLAKYEINEYIPLLAEQFVSALASPKDVYNCPIISSLYNNPTFPFYMSNQLHILSTAVCSLPVCNMIFVQGSMVIQHTFGFMSAVFSPDGKYVVTASNDGTAKIYDIEKKEVIDTIAHTCSLKSATFSPDVKYVVTASSDGTAKIYDIEKKEVIDTIRHISWVKSAIFSPDSKYVVTFSNDGMAKIYDIADQQVVRTITHADGLESAVFSPDSKCVATASWDNTAKIYDITKEKAICTISHTDVVYSAVFSPDGKYAVTASRDGTAKIYDITEEKIIHTLHHDNWVISAQFSLNGMYVVTASCDGTAKIYDIEKKEVIGTITHTAWVNSATFSPDGKYIVTASSDNTAKIYNITAQKVIGTIAHTDVIYSAVFSLNGKYVLTASVDGTAKIYDIEAQQVIRTIAHNDWVNSATFSPDGKYVLTASNNGMACITPLTLCGMPDMQVITIATLIEIAKQMAAAEEVEPLVKTGWLYKEVKKLSAYEQHGLFEKFPQIKELIDNVVDDQEQQQGKKQ